MPRKVSDMGKRLLAGGTGIILAGVSLYLGSGTSWWAQYSVQTATLILFLTALLMWRGEKENDQKELGRIINEAVIKAFVNEVTAPIKEYIDRHFPHFNAFESYTESEANDKIVKLIKASPSGRPRYVYNTCIYPEDIADAHLNLPIIPQATKAIGDWVSGHGVWLEIVSQKHAMQVVKRKELCENKTGTYRCRLVPDAPFINFIVFDYPPEDKEVWFGWDTVESSAGRAITIRTKDFRIVNVFLGLFSAIMKQPEIELKTEVPTGKPTLIPTLAKGSSSEDAGIVAESRKHSSVEKECSEKEH